MNIHPSAVVSESVQLGDGVEIGPFCLVSGNVTIGSGTVLKERVSIEGNTVIGSNNVIYAGAVIGSPPQDAAYRGEQTWTVIGDRNHIREYTTINAAAKGETDRTVVGDDNMFLAYSHVGHNCVVGDNIVMANSVNLGGYVTVGDNSYLGGNAGVHQFVRVGRLTTISGYSKTIQDVPPFMTVSGQPTRVVGLNSIGLDRAGLGPAEKGLIKKALFILFRSNRSHKAGIELIRRDLEPHPLLDELIEFITASRRGVCRGAKQADRD